MGVGVIPFSYPSSRSDCAPRVDQSAIQSRELVLSRLAAVAQERTIRGRHRVDGAVSVAASPASRAAAHRKASPYALSSRQRWLLVPTAVFAVLGLSATGSMGVPRIGDMVDAARQDDRVLVSSPPSSASELVLSEPVQVGRVRVVASAKAKRAVAALTGEIDGIPTRALAAYQASAAVLKQADPKCHLGWSFLAAFGSIESDHGRGAGSVLTPDGVSKPGIFGVVLDGKHGGSRVLDTDNGKLDGDKRFDRAVGPMQFIPGTWRVVGADGDRDGKRNPQDIDDAALAAGMFLCAGTDNLGTDTGMRRAAMRYNHSASYADQVVALAHRYAAGGVPATTAEPATVAAAPVLPPQPTPTKKPKRPKPTATPTPTPSPTSTPSPSDPSPTGTPTPSGAP